MTATAFPTWIGFNPVDGKPCADTDLSELDRDMQVGSHRIADDGEDATWEAEAVELIEDAGWRVTGDHHVDGDVIAWTVER